jgi:hypothetical protein
MPNLTPEQRAEAIAEFRSQSHHHRNIKLEYRNDPQMQAIHEQLHAKYSAAADALEALPGLAEQNRVMREALCEIAKPGAEDAHQDADIPFVCWLCGEPDGDCLAECPRTVANTALALTPSAAEAQAKANAEKASLLDYVLRKMARASDCGVGGDEESSWVEFVLTIQVPEPKGWPSFEAEEWTPDQIADALGAAKEAARG